MNTIAPLDKMSPTLETAVVPKPSVQALPASWMRSSVLILLLSSAFAGPMLWLHRDSLRNLISFHGTLHLAISQQFTQGQFPPENPFYAGEPIGYYWFFQYISYHIADALHMDVLHAVELLCLISLAGLVVIAVAIGRKLWGSSIAGACLGFLVLVGANGLGWLVLLAKIIRDGPQIMSGPASAVVSPILVQVQYGDLRYGPNFTYYYHMTSRPLAITLTLAMVGCLYWSFQKRSWIANLLLAIATALCVAINPLIGLAAGGALVGGMLFNKACQTYGSTRNSLNYEPADTMLMSSGAIILGCVCAWPTFSHLLTGGSSAGIKFDPFRWKLYGIVLVNALILIPLAWVGYRRLNARSMEFGRSAITGVVLLVVGTLLFAMPGTLSATGNTGNEHNLFNTAMVLLAIPASGAVMRLRSSSQADKRSPLIIWRVVALFLFFLPTTILIMSSYLGRAPVSVTLNRDGMAWQDKTKPMAKFYSWVTTKTAPDAVFVISPDQVARQLCNVSDFPAFTRRYLFTDWRTYMTDGYLDSQYRADLSTKLATGQAMSMDDRDYLKGLDRPVYVTSYLADDTLCLDGLRRAYGEPLFLADNIAAFQLLP